MREEFPNPIQTSASRSTLSKKAFQLKTPRGAGGGILGCVPDLSVAFELSDNRPDTPSDGHRKRFPQSEGTGTRSRIREQLGRRRRTGS